MAAGDDPEWSAKAATLSDKSAAKEFGLSKSEILEAVRAGTLQCRVQSSYGSPWLRLLRREVEALVNARRGGADVVRQKATAELAQVDSDLRELRRRLAQLARRRMELLELLMK